MNLSKDSLHHAYILEGNSEHIYPKLCAFCEEELDLNTQGNPDFVYQVYDKFLILDAHALRKMQMNKPINGDKKIFVLSFNFITREAQNTLLKVLEEPTKGTHIFLVTPSKRLFLETVLSRVILIPSSELQADSELSNAEEFLKADIKNRMSTVSKIVKNIKDEKISKVEAINLVKNLKKIIHKEAISKKDYQKLHTLENISKIEDYLHDNSASVKMLLEHVAVSV